MEEFTKVDEILDWLDSELSKPKELRQRLDHHDWIRCAQTLNVLRSTPQEELCALRNIIAKKKVEWKLQGINGIDRKDMAEASDEYLLADMLKAKLERITELIRISKEQARLSHEEYKGY